MGFKVAARYPGPSRVYHFDIEDEMRAVGPMKLTEDISYETLWLTYVEEVLERDCGLNVVRTQRSASGYYPYLKYLDWKLSTRAPLPGKLYIPDLVWQHAGEQCWVYLSGSSLLIVYY